MMNFNTDNHRILIVEDDTDLRTSLVRIFEREQFHVHQCSGGNEAFNLVQNTQIDLVLSDVRMSHGTGIELLKRLREKDPDYPLVVLATGFSDHNEQEILQMGAQAVISKPFQKKTILSLITHLLKRFQK